MVSPDYLRIGHTGYKMNAVQKSFDSDAYHEQQNVGAARFCSRTKAGAVDLKP
jgi:hypothetical protein